LEARLRNTSTAATSAVVEIELAGMDGIEAARMLERGEEKVFVVNATIRALSHLQD
jgi:hypothetical protein